MSIFTIIIAAILYLRFGMLISDRMELDSVAHAAVTVWFWPVIFVVATVLAISVVGSKDLIDGFKKHNKRGL